jgi:hypothetical protein
MTNITTEAEAIAAGYTVRMFLEGQGASFEALLRPDTDLDGAFECFCVDDPEMLIVSGWLCDTIEAVVDEDPTGALLG